MLGGRVRISKCRCTLVVACGCSHTESNAQTRLPCTRSHVVLHPYEHACADTRKDPHTHTHTHTHTHHTHTIRMHSQSHGTQQGARMRVALPCPTAPMMIALVLMSIHMHTYLSLHFPGLDCFAVCLRMGIERVCDWLSAWSGFVCSPPKNVPAKKKVYRLQHALQHGFNKANNKLIQVLGDNISFKK